MKHVLRLRVFIDRLGSHLSLTAVLNGSLAGRVRRRGSPAPRGRLSHEGMDKYSAAPRLISLAKLSGETPPPPPPLGFLLSPSSFLASLHVCTYVLTYTCVCTSSPGRTLPFVGHHLLWPYYVLVCEGIKGWADGYYGEGEGFELHSHRLMSPLTPRRYFGFFCVFAREQLGVEKQIYEPPENLHVCGWDGLRNALVTPGGLLLSRRRQMERSSEEAFRLQQWCDLFFVLPAGVNGPSHSQYYQYCRVYYQSRAPQNWLFLECTSTFSLMNLSGSKAVI